MKCLDHQMVTERFSLSSEAQTQSEQLRLLENLDGITVQHVILLH